MKYWMMIVLTGLSISTLSAKNKVLSGDLSVFNDKSATATVIFDYSNLNIEGKPYMEHLKSKGKNFVNDWPSESAVAEAYFIKCWNHDNDGGIQVTASEGNKYTMVIVCEEMHMGSGAASMLVGFGAGGAKLDGKMYIFENGNQIPLLTVEIDGQSGRSGMTEIQRRTDLYGELAEDLVTAIKKTKPSKIKEATSPVDISGFQIAGESVIDQNQQVSSDSAVLEHQSKENPEKNRSTSAKETKVSNKTDISKPEKSDEIEGSVMEILANAQGEEIGRRRKPVKGDFDEIADQKKIGVYLDFSNAEIDGRSEKRFIRHMQTSAKKKDLDENFDETWKEDVKPQLMDIFIEEANDKLKNKKIRLKLCEELSTPYVLKLEIVEVSDDGDLKINYLFVNMSTGEVEAQITLESKGGHVGKFVGLLKQGFENAGEDFADKLIDQID